MSSTPKSTVVNGIQVYLSNVVRAHRRVHYIGHALEMPANATEADMLDYVARISTQCYSAECAPYAFRLHTDNVQRTRRGKYWEEQLFDEEDEERKTCDDNGEFSAGSILAACLRNCEKKYSKRGVEGIGGNTGNILLVVTRKVEGCFVTDMVQPLKYSAIRSCGTQALERLNCHFSDRNKTIVADEGGDVISKSMTSPGKSRKGKMSIAHKTLPMPPPESKISNKKIKHQKSDHIMKKQAVNIDNIPEFNGSINNKNRK